MRGSIKVMCAEYFIICSVFIGRFRRELRTGVKERCKPSLQCMCIKRFSGTAVRVRQHPVHIKGIIVKKKLVVKKKKNKKKFAKKLQLIKMKKKPTQLILNRCKLCPLCSVSF